MIGAFSSHSKAFWNLRATRCGPLRLQRHCSRAAVSQISIASFRTSRCRRSTVLNYYDWLLQQGRSCLSFSSQDTMKLGAGHCLRARVVTDCSRNRLTRKNSSWRSATPCGTQSDTHLGQDDKHQAPSPSAHRFAWRALGQFAVVRPSAFLCSWHWRAHRWVKAFTRRPPCVLRSRPAAMSRNFQLRPK